MKDLKTLSYSNLNIFFNSFEQVICDVDGVIWKGFVALPGSADCVESFKSLGKPVKLATNYGNLTESQYQDLLTKNKINLKATTDVINPLKAIIDYLQEKKFDKTLFVIGHEGLKLVLENAGFNVIKNLVYEVESIDEFLKHTQDESDIGAVVCEFDINMNLITLQKVLSCLKRKDCLFIVGAGDKLAPLTENITLLYNYHYIQLLMEHSNREYIQFAKPSVHFKNFLLKKFNITRPETILFIGDSVDEDIKFAKKCGFKTLLVLSGITKPEHLENWPFLEEDRPDYFIESLDVLNNILNQTFTFVKNKI